MQKIQASEKVVNAYSDNTVIQSTYTSNTDLSDEWDLAYISTELPIDLEAQETIHTCWAAAARMFASVYNADSIPLQDELTFEIREDFNEGATVSEMEEAIKLCLGLQNTDEEFALQDKVYSEENLQTILKSGHPLAAGIMWYQPRSNEPTKITGGHAIVIYGICEIDNIVYYLLRDPGPHKIGTTRIVSYGDLRTNYLYHEDNQSATIPVTVGMWAHTFVYLSKITNGLYSEPRTYP